MLKWSWPATMRRHYIRHQVVEKFRLIMLLKLFRSVSVWGIVRVRNVCRQRTADVVVRELVDCLNWGKGIIISDDARDNLDPFHYSLLLGYSTRAQLLRLVTSLWLLSVFCSRIVCRSLINGWLSHLPDFIVRFIYLRRTFKWPHYHSCHPVSRVAPSGFALNPRIPVHTKIINNNDLVKTILCTGEFN